MNPMIYHFWDFAIPGAGYLQPDNGAMPQSKIIQALGANLRNLRKSDWTPEGKRAANEYAKWIGVSNGTMNRIERGLTDPQLSHLIRIALKYAQYGLQPWHLLVPGLDLTDLPALVTAKERQFHQKLEQAYEELRQSSDNEPERLGSKHL